MKRLITAAALAAAIGAVDLSAQQIPQQLTLEEAQRLARLYNPEYRQEENNAGPAAAAVRQRFASFLPSLSTSLSFGGNHSWSQSAVDDFGRPISETRTVEVESSSASQGAGLSMVLFDGGANIRNLSAARASQRSTDARIADRGNTLRANVARDYFAALQAVKTIELEEALLAARKDDLERREKQLVVVASKYIDVLNARVQVATAEQAVEQARSNAEKARITLRQTMGVEGATPFTIGTEPADVFDPSTLNADALVQRAQTSNPTVLAAAAGLEVADRSASVARAARLPRISGGVNFGRSASTRGYDAIGQFDLPNRSLGFNIQVQLPLFSQLQTSANIAQADANELDNREALRRARLSVEGFVRSALIDLNNAYRTVQLSQLRADISREQLNVAEEEYRRGVSGMDAFRLQQIVDGEAAARRQLLEARFGFVRALINLEERLGAPLER